MKNKTKLPTFLSILAAHNHEITMEVLDSATNSSSNGVLDVVC
jgi:hypothetical protein